MSLNSDAPVIPKLLDILLEAIESRYGFKNEKFSMFVTTILPHSVADTHEFLHFAHYLLWRTHKGETVNFPFKHVMFPTNIPADSSAETLA